VPHPLTDPPETADEKVWVATSRRDPQLDKMFLAAKVQPLEEGVIGGVSGSLLVAGITRRIPVAVLMVSAQVSEGFPDHRAGAVLIETLDRLMPELAIDTGPLRGQAEVIERALRAAMRQQAKGKTELPSGDTPDRTMYQ
jgi:predicted ATP-grasp superfamily ATP-dependent carboligase